MRKLSNIISFYAVSPIHAGAESSTGAIDNPIQREKHTNYPFVQANGVKGSMRAHFRKQEINSETINFIFGTDAFNDKNAANHKDKDGKNESMAGAISVSDAKLFAMPVRSNVAPFVWVTCPTILKRLKTDLELAGLESFAKAPNISEDDAKIIGDWSCEESNIILEDAVVIKKGTSINATLLKKYFPQAEKLLLISDEMFKYVSENCTEIQTQIKINSEKGTAQDGALRYSEFLPSDTILYSVVAYDNAYLNDLKAETIKNYIESTFNNFMQIGGDATLGRGIVKLSWLGGAK